ncbi:MAG: malate synthase, partial [Porticoccaceae bacterium]
MSQRIEESGLKVAKPIHDLVNQSILPGTGVTAAMFWAGFAAILAEFGPKNKALLDKRDQLQSQIDSWHRANSSGFDFADYKGFLQEIGYLVPEGGEFAVSPENVDTEIAKQAGPQLVVPIMNARFALNAVNARWGSLYDALYGNDVISEQEGAEKAGAYNAVRGQKVIDYGRDFLDGAAPLSHGSHHQATRYSVTAGQLIIALEDGTSASLQAPDQLSGYLGDTDNPSSILIKNNNLHLELQVDYNHIIGQSDKAGVKDIVLESALTTIMDCEDSVAAVDADDKALAYGNWLGLIKG